MFKVVVSKRPLRGEKLERVGYLRRDVVDRREGVGVIEQYIAKYDHNGWNGEHDYWWCRNNSDKANTIFFIE